MALCMGCMEQIPDHLEVCPLCGYVKGTEVSEVYYIKPGTVLQGHFVLGKVLGYGGFGVTYIGYDNVLQKKIAVKEYFPSDYATRKLGVKDMLIYSGDAYEQFEAGLDSFIEEARKLAVFSDVPEIVRIYDCFKENRTGYIVMEYLKGRTVKELLAERKQFPYAEAESIIVSVLNGLTRVHREGIVHRDIAPDNIFITENGTVKILDFGASRYAAPIYTRSLSVILKPGYAPEEQYRSYGEQGPWTDVYGVGATFYRMITGIRPPEALERMVEDELQPPSELGVEISPKKEAVLLKSLGVLKENRIPSAEEFKRLLLESDVRQPLQPSENDGAEKVGQSIGGGIRNRKTGGVKRWIPVAVIASCCLVGIVVLGKLFANRKTETSGGNQPQSVVNGEMAAMQTEESNLMDEGEQTATESVASINYVAETEPKEQSEVEPKRQSEAESVAQSESESESTAQSEAESKKQNEVEPETETEMSTSVEDTAKTMLASVLSQASSLTDEQIIMMLESDDVSSAAIASNWYSVKDELGAFVEVTDAEISTDGASVIGHAKYEKVKDDADVTVIYVMNPKTETVTINWIINYPSESSELESGSEFESTAQSEAESKKQNEVESEMETETSTSVEDTAKTMLTSVLSQASSLTDEQIIMMLESDDVSKAAVASNWYSVKDELGAFVEVTDAEISTNGATVIGHAKYEKVKDDADVTVIYALNPKAETVTVNWLINYPSESSELESEQNRQSKQETVSQNLYHLTIIVDGKSRELQIHNDTSHETTGILITTIKKWGDSVVYDDKSGQSSERNPITIENDKLYNLQLYTWDKTVLKLKYYNLDLSKIEEIWLKEKKKDGYVYINYRTADSTETVSMKEYATKTYDEVQTRYALANGLRVRRLPNTDDTVGMSFDNCIMGEELQVYGTANGVINGEAAEWYLIRTDSGYGFISASDEYSTDDKATADEAVAAAQRAAQQAAQNSSNSGSYSGGNSGGGESNNRSSSTGKNTTVDVFDSGRSER